MTTVDTVAADAAALEDDPELTPGERAWLEARLEAMGVAHQGPLRRTPLEADADGWIVLSTDPAESALPPLVPDGGGAPVFAAEHLRVRAGGTLEVRAPGGEAVRVVAGRLTLAAGARLTLPPPGELHAARAELGAGSAFELIGKDGMAGLSGADGKPGPGFTGPYGATYLPDGGNGDEGVPGERGGTGGGVVYLESLVGTATVIAGGGNGAPGGDGGRGGDGFKGVGGPYRAGNGGNGGPGAPGGDGGDGGTVVVDVALQPGAALNMVARPSSGAPGGGGGGRGVGGSNPASRRGSDGKPGAEGKHGGPGELTVFSLRRRDG